MKEQRLGKHDRYYRAIIYCLLCTGHRAGLFTGLVSLSPPGVCVGVALGGTQLPSPDPGPGHSVSAPPLEILKTIFWDCAAGEIHYHYILKHFLP